jgi:hypothetical protein
MQTKILSKGGTQNGLCLEVAARKWILSIKNTFSAFLQDLEEITAFAGTNRGDRVCKHTYEMFVNKILPS